MLKYIRTFFTNPDLPAMNYGRTIEMEAANKFFELIKKKYKNLVIFIAGKMHASK